jgi:hypothetical protein
MPLNDPKNLITSTKAAVEQQPDVMKAVEMMLGHDYMLQ